MKTKMMLAAVSASVLASAANAAQVRLVTENGGNSWTFGSQYVSLVGARDVASGTTLFYQDILDMVTSGAGNIVGIYNGINDATLPANTGDVTYGSGDANPANGIEEFVSALFNSNGRHVGVFYVVHTGTVVFRAPTGQTNTLGTNGALGAFDGSFGVAIVPLPPAAFAGLGLLGVMGGVAAVKRRRVR